MKVDSCDIAEIQVWYLKSCISRCLIGILCVICMCQM